MVVIVLPPIFILQDDKLEAARKFNEEYERRMTDLGLDPDRDLQQIALQKPAAGYAIYVNRRLVKERALRFDDARIDAESKDLPTCFDERQFWVGCKIIDDFLTGRSIDLSNIFR